MMLTIHGLPLFCKYHDLKLLIKQECNLSDFILDNLVGDGDASKKVRIGVADESEGAHLIKCLDGYRMSGNVLRVLPVAKPVLNQPQGNFDQRGGYPPRNDMPNQPGNYGNQAMPNMGNRPQPWAPNTNQWSPNQPSGPQRSQNNFGYQQQQNQPYQQQQPPQQQQRSEPKQFPQRDMRNRMPQEQAGYGFPQKTNVPEPNRRVPRSVDVAVTARGEPPPGPAGGRFHNDKPVTINKDYFQGSNQFGAPQGNQPPHFQAPSQNRPSQWGQQIQQQKPPPQFSKPQFDEERKFSQSDKRPVLQKSEQDMRMPSGYKGYEKPFPDSPHGRRASPPARRVSPPGRRVSPHMGRVLPDGRRVSPHPRPGSPPGRPADRRMSPSARRMSPSARRMSPSARRMSPGGRRISPNRRVPGHQSPHHDAPRKMSPHKRFSPHRRLVSPSRRDPERRESPSRHAPRFSPSRRPADKMDKFAESRASKPVRPAYEPEAANQAMYSGGYRPNLHENVQYPIPGARGADQRSSTWQQEREKAPFAPHIKKQDDDRRDSRPIAPPRGPEHRPEAIVEPKRASPPLKSRSPNRRDGRERSPLRDRYRRHSPSPRSPRRSWALEKRRSPALTDAPPPPVWPGAPAFPDRPDKDEPKKLAPWDRRPFDEPARRPAPDARPFEPSRGIRIRTDLVPPEPRAEPPRGFQPLPERYSPKLHEPRFEPREDYKDQRDYRRPENAPDRKTYPDREEFRDFQRGEDRDRRRDEFPRRDDFRREDRKESFPRRDDGPDQRKDHDMFQKEFEDIYKRAKEFKQKVQELRRPDRGRDDYRDDHRRDMERGDDRRKMLEDHSRERRGEARHDYPDLDRLRQEERPRSHHSDEYSRHRDLDWKDDKSKPPSKPINADAQAKRDKAAEEIATKILERHGNFGMSPDVRNRILKELINVVLDIINHMFGYKDVSFIETVIKFNAKHTDRDEYKIFQNVMGNFPNLPKAVKRHGEGDSEIPAKTSRRSPEKLKQDDSSLRAPDQHRPRSSYGADRSLRPKPPRGATLTRSVAKPELKPKAPSSRAQAGSSAPLAQPNAEGLYELSPRTYRMLKAELDHVMFSVVKDLPDAVDLNCEGERDIVERWRNELGDHLKDVLGLNVSKRLLNIFNPLNVKVHFTTKPDRKYLSTFLKRYNFVAFKRLAGVVNTFAAQVKTIADFDALCTAKSIHCGAAKITITPFYRFMQCPKKIKTVFCNTENMNALESNESSENIDSTKDHSLTATKNEDATNPSKPDVTKIKPKAEAVVNKLTATNNTPKVEETKTETKITAPTSTKTFTPKVESPKSNMVKPTPIAETSTPKVLTPAPKIDNSKPKLDPPKPKVETPRPKIVTPAPKVQVKPTSAPKAEAPKVATPITKPALAVKAQRSALLTEAPKVKVDMPNPKVDPAKIKVEDIQQDDNNKKTEVSKANLKVDEKTKNTVKVPVQTTNNAIKTTPGNIKTTPANIKATPATVKATPATVKTLPATIKSTPATVKSTPATIKATPATVKTTSAAIKATTATVKTTPATIKSTPATVKGTPANTKATPANTKATPANTKATPANTKATPAKTVAKTATTSNTKVTKSAATNKYVPAKKTAFPNKKDTKKVIEKDDYEELDDRDILALISEGIVLDECSGSDEN